MKNTTKTENNTKTVITYNAVQTEIRKALKSINTKSSNLDNKIANNTMLLVVNYLKGAKRENYSELKKELVANLELNSYAKSVLNLGFEYKEFKIMSNIELLPFSTIKKLVATIKSNDTKNHKTLIEKLFALYTKTDNMKTYKEKVDKFIVTNKIVHEIKIDIKKESNKIIEKCTKKEILELILELQKATKIELKKVS